MTLPASWSHQRLDHIANLSRGKFSARPRNDPRFFGGDVPFVQTGDVRNAHVHLRDFSQTLNSEGVKVSRVFPRGTMLFTIAANIGDLAFLSFDAACPDSLVAIEPKQGINERWLFYQLTAFKADFEAAATQNAQLNINLEKLNPFKVPVPPFYEQQAIAAALSDADGVVAGLERVIAKKRLIKQGAMQDLLTARHRLPGFSGEWEVKRLGDALTVRHGRSQKEVEHPTGEYPILATGGQIGTATKFLCDKPSVLIGRKGTIDVPRFMDTPFWSVDTLFYTDVHSGYDARFLFYVFLMVDWMSFNEASGVPSLNAKTIENIEVQLPKIEEQQAIAAVLSDMDVEIQTLEARLTKARAVKEGMMQNLLTGRVRLV